jgi:hypothetical protein
MLTSHSSGSIAASPRFMACNASADVPLMLAVGHGSQHGTVCNAGDNPVGTLVGIIPGRQAQITAENRRTSPAQQTPPTHWADIPRFCERL